MNRLNQVKKMNANHQAKLFGARNNSRVKGFSLIELMVSVSIIGIVSALAYPSYVGYVSSSLRTEGQTELLRLANLEEQYYVDFRTYTVDLKLLGEESTAIYTENKNYYIRVEIADASEFEMRAYAKEEQATNDSDCTPLTITHAGEKGPEGCWD